MKLTLPPIERLDRDVSASGLRVVVKQRFSSGSSQGGHCADQEVRGGTHCLRIRKASRSHNHDPLSSATRFGVSALQNVMVLQDCEDIRYVAGALKALGIELEMAACKMVVHGCSGKLLHRARSYF